MPASAVFLVASWFFQRPVAPVKSVAASERRSNLARVASFKLSNSVRVPVPFMVWMLPLALRVMKVEALAVLASDSTRSVASVGL